MVVSETYCAKRGKSKVNDNDCILAGRILIELKFFNETYVLTVLICFAFYQQLILRDESQIAEDVPEYSHEVADCDDDHYQLESLEEVGYHQNCHDVVVIEVTVVGQLRLVIYDPLQSSLEKVFDVTHEGV